MFDHDLIFLSFYLSDKYLFLFVWPKTAMSTLIKITLCIESWICFKSDWQNGKFNQAWNCIVLYYLYSIWIWIFEKPYECQELRRRKRPIPHFFWNFVWKFNFIFIFYLLILYPRWSFSWSWSYTNPALPWLQNIKHKNNTILKIAHAE